MICHTRTLALGALLLASLHSAANAARVQACQNDVQGPGKTLKAAIEEGGVVTFDCPAGTTINVTRGYPINRPVTINGQGRITLRIQSGPVFTVSGASGVLSLNGLRIVAGTTPVGPAPLIGRLRLFLVQGGTLKIEDTLIENVREALGAVMAGGRLELLTNTRIRAVAGLTLQESALVASRVVLEDWSQPLALTGGSADVQDARMARTKLRLRDCTIALSEVQFSENDVRSRNENGGALETDCAGTINRATFSFNKAKSGGGLHVQPGRAGKLTITHARFERNEALESGGGAYIVGGRRGLPLGPAPGPELDVELQFSTFIGNTAANGGGLYSSGLKLRAARFKSNVATQRGGGHFVNGGGATQRASFVSNRAAEGGGLFAVNTSLANALVVRNEATRAAGIFGGNIDLSNVTVADNTGGAGLDAGIFHTGFRLKNTLVVNNSGGNCATGGNVPTVASVSTSMQFPGNSCAAAMTTGDPYLDSMYAPVAGSPARSGGDLPTCLAAPVSGRDFYGEPRPQGKACSIGAVEGAVDRLVYRRLRDPGVVPNDLLQAVNERLRQLLGQR